MLLRVAEDVQEKVFWVFMVCSLLPTFLYAFLPAPNREDPAIFPYAEWADYLIQWRCGFCILGLKVLQFPAYAAVLAFSRRRGRMLVRLIVLHLIFGTTAVMLYDVI